MGLGWAAGRKRLAVGRRERRESLGGWAGRQPGQCWRAPCGESAAGAGWGWERRRGSMVGAAPGAVALEGGGREAAGGAGDARRSWRWAGVLPDLFLGLSALEGL